MSKMACLCGGVLRNNTIPCPTEGWLFRDQAQDAYHFGACRDIAAFMAAALAGRRAAWIAAYFSPEYPDVGDQSIVHDILCAHKQEVVLSVAECDQCGRLWVQREPEVNAYRSYAPDQPGYAGVLRSKMTVEEIEAWLGRALPEPYRAFLTVTAEDFLARNDRTLVYGRDAVIERNDSYESKTYCPGCLMIGDDSGGAALVLSLADGAVHRVDMGAMTPDCFAPVAPSFTAWAEAGFPCGDD